MARLTTPLGLSRLILTLAMVVSLGFGAAVLTSTAEEGETVAGSLSLQAIGSDDTIDDGDGRNAQSTTTTSDETLLPKVLLPANPRETRENSAGSPPNTPPTTTATTKVKSSAVAGSKAVESQTLVDDAADLPLTPLPAPTTTRPLPKPSVPTTLMQISDEPAFDPQRCTVRLIDNVSAQLTWSGAVAPNGYEVRRNNVVIGSALLTATSYTDTTMSKMGTEYHFSVSAIGSGAKTWCGFVVRSAGADA